MCIYFYLIIFSRNEIDLILLILLLSNRQAWLILEFSINFKLFSYLNCSNYFTTMNINIIRFFSLFILTFTLCQSLSAQNISSRCNSTGYTGLLDLPIENSTVKYAENINILMQNQSLYMNIFEPSLDTAAFRPVIILAFGGSFVAGNRNDLNDLCAFYAQHGYVAVTIDYRLYNLIFGLDMVKYTETILGAMSDMRAAVRYMKIDAATDNFYRVDTNAIFVGGYSAGAFTALNTAYLDESDISDDLPDYILAAYETLGTVEGNTGEPSTFAYSSKVAGVLNLSGALLDSTFLEEGEPMLMSMHGTADETVSFGAGLALNLFPVHGSGSCHNRANEVSLPSYLYPVEGGGHNDIYDSPNFETDRLSFYEDVLGLMNDKICENVSVNTQYYKEEQVFKLFPNPAQNLLNIISDDQIGRVEISDMSGKLLYEFDFKEKTAQLNTSLIGTGMYILTHLKKDGSRHSQKIVIAN